MSEPRRRSPLLVAVFEREDDLLHAAAAARKEGLHIVDAFAPYAVHGLDRAMGLRPSRLPWVCFVLGLLGAGSMLLFQYWATAISWPINVGGKPWNSLPAFIPVTFEVMVLCAGVGTVVAFIWSSGLRPGRRSALSDLRVTDDRFALAIRETAALRPRFRRKTLLAVSPGGIEERDISDGESPMDRRTLNRALGVALVVSVGLNVAALRDPSAP